MMEMIESPNYTTSQPYYVTTSNTNQLNVTNWAAITGVTTTQTVPTNTAIRYLVSFDGRTTWKKWNGSAWVEATTGANLGSYDIQTNGMTQATLQAITQAQWAVSGAFTFGTTTSLNFAVDLKTTVTTAGPSVSLITVNYIPAYNISTTKSAMDLSATNAINFYVRSDRVGAFMKIGFGESGITEQSSNITVNAANTWELKSWDISGITVTARDEITKFGFSITDAGS